MTLTQADHHINLITWICLFKSDFLNDVCGFPEKCTRL